MNIDNESMNIDNESKNKNDEKYMRRAIEIAKKGIGWANPNPLVGAVIVKNDKIIGEGAHLKYGSLHAERNAILSAKDNLEKDDNIDSIEGSTIYVTLEPCCHYGKTPPCTEAIIDNKIKRVVIGSRDPNPKVSGKGVRILREAGIEVITDFLKEECDALNDIFFHYIKNKRPYVLMKYAMTADGKIVTSTGKSKWITSALAREYVQEIRHKYMGIMVGIGTVLADDPLLNCRAKNIRNPRHPIRIICDSNLRIPIDSNIVKTASRYETILVIADKNLNMGEVVAEDIKLSTTEKGEKLNFLLDKKIKILNIFDKNNTRIDLNSLMKYLGEEGMDSILLEGGGILNESALESGIVNEIMSFISPKIFGGGGKSPVSGNGIDEVSDAIKLSIKDIKMIGEDILIDYYVGRKEK